MEFKKLMSAVVMLGALSFGATTASAEIPWLTTLNNSLSTSFPNCIVCHGSATNVPKNKGITAIASTRGVIGLTTDSDGDGFTDLQEVRGLNMDFNFAAVTPFTLADTAETGALPNAAVNVIETASGALVVETATADVYADFAITVPGGSEVVADMYATVVGANSTLTYRVPVPTGSTIYTVDKALGTSTDQTGTTTFNANGSITLGVAANDIVAVRVTPVTGSAGGGSGGGCVTSSATTPLMMLLAMLTLGFFVRRKKD